ncbi:MAG: hypothetical protein ABSG87_03980 [Verrucomicrobiota bacterium]|jgi:hypothetical protein
MNTTFAAGKILRRFDFGRDRFAFANELIWEYQFDPTTNKTSFHRREPKPNYAHRCFVLTRAARQFLYHARFDAGQKTTDDETYRRLIRKVVSRNPRTPCEPNEQIIIPGFASLYEFSRAQEKLLKTECGGAWRSYFLRSHWRMVFPISRTHQECTSARLAAAIKQNFSPIVHLVRFPSLTINHGMILFEVAESVNGLEFSAYDPNNSEKPTCIKFDRALQIFFLRANSYWAGGELNVIEIYRGWFL